MLKPVQGNRSSLHSQIRSSSLTTFNETEVDTINVAPDTHAGPHILQPSEATKIEHVLSRTIKIYSGTWAEGANFNIELKPLTLMLAEASITNKLKGYGLCRFDMKLDVSISASPFQYSAALVSMLPLGDFGTTSTCGHPDSISTTEGVQPTGAVIDIIQKSQRPGSSVLYPQECTKLTLRHPFTFPMEWLELPYTSSINYLSLAIDSFTTLNYVGTATGLPVTITVFCTLENVELANPTLTYQSHTLSGLAHDIKRIGFSDASVWVSGAAALAKLAGLTNHATQGEVTQVSSNPLTSISSTDKRIPTDFFGIAPESGLDTSPGARGFPDIDELNIAYIGAKESYLGLIPVNSGLDAGSRVATFYVTPETSRSFTSTANSFTYNYRMPTPAGYLCSMFKHWRGDVEYRFRIVATPFHRGKIRIIYDPSGSIPDGSVPEGFLYSEIIDISESKEAVMRIPFSSPTPWQGMEGSMSGDIAMNSNQNYSLSSLLPTMPYIRQDFNGSLRVEILEEIVATSGSASISILAFTRTHNLELAIPALRTYGLSTVTINPVRSWVYQSLVTNTDPSPITTLPSEIYMGESLVSLRELLHRSTYYKTLLPSLTAMAAMGLPVPPDPTDYLVTSMLEPRPYPFGVNIDTYSSDSRSSVATAVNNRFNYVNDSFLTRLLPMFLGYRGGFRWKFQIHTEDKTVNAGTDYNNINKPTTALSVARGLNTNIGTTNLISTCMPFGTMHSVLSGSQGERLGLIGSQDDSAGYTTVSEGISAVTVDFPDQSVLLFRPTNSTIHAPTNIVTATNSRIDNRDCMKVMVKNSIYSALAEGTHLSKGVISYVSTTPDFTPYCFQCAPALYITSGAPPPASTTI